MNMDVEVKLALLDQVIILSYFILIVVVGVIMTKIASKGINSYFLGGKKIPWWVLGASGTASNFDIAGTTLIVSFIYLLGLKGFWVAMRGGAAIPLAFLMVFLGKWYRRTRVMTEAEYMKIRFGEGKGGKAARTLAAVANIVIAIGLVIYFSKAAGNFVGQFIKIVPDPTINAHICAGIMLAIGMGYTVSSGLFGVVFTDVVQEIMIIITAVYISVKAFFISGAMTLPERFTTFDLPFELDVPGHPEYNLFTFTVMFFILKGVLEGMGGFGNYMAQRYYAARNEREAGLMTAEWILLLGFRWTMIMAIAILGLTLRSKIGMGAGAAEKVLPIVIRDMLPEGVRGMALAGLIAAAMSTFDSTINAGAAYFVRDIYQTKLKPDADDEDLMRMSRMSSAAIAIIGYGLSLLFENINDVWNFITASLTAGLFVPLVLRWYWGRFNGFGFAWGVGSGIGASLILQVIDRYNKVQLGDKFVPMAPYVTFPLVMAVSLIVSIVVTLKTKPVDDEVSMEFLRRTRVGGFWERIKRKMDFDFVRDITIEHLNDIISVVLALPAQMCLLFGAMCFVIHDWQKFITCMVIFLFCCVGLYFFWYKNLRNPEETGEAEEERMEEEEQEAIARRMWETEQKKEELKEKEREEKKKHKKKTGKKEEGKKPED